MMQVCAMACVCTLWVSVHYGASVRYGVSVCAMGECACYVA